MNKLILFLTTSFVAGNGFCMDDPYNMTEQQQIAYFAYLDTNPRGSLADFLEEDQRQRTAQNQEAEAANLAYLLGQGLIIDQQSTSSCKACRASSTCG